MGRKKQGYLPDLPFPPIITLIAVFVVLAALLLFAYVGLRFVSSFFNFDFNPLNLPQPTQHSLCKGTAGCWLGNVTRVVDGDTLVFELAGDPGGSSPGSSDAQISKKIRLALVNTPEKNESGWAEATSFTTARCLGKAALIDQDDRQLLDKYGRTVALVYCGDGIGTGKTLNEELLSFGLAELWTNFCSKSEFRNEPWAKANGC